MSTVDLDPLFELPLAMRIPPLLLNPDGVFGMEHCFIIRGRTYEVCPFKGSSYAMPEFISFLTDPGDRVGKFATSVNHSE